MTSLGLIDHVYVRTDATGLDEAFAEFGNAPQTFLDFYRRFSGPFSSETMGFSLLDPVDQDVNIRTQTVAARETVGLDARYLVLSDLVGNAVLVYDRETDAVFEMDFEGGDRALAAGTLAPTWNSFSGFLEDYFGGPVAP